MRHHPSTHLSFPEYERVHHSNRRAMFDRENPDKRPRLRQMRKNKCNPFGERGIKITDLPAGSRVPEIIRQHSWEGFIRTRAGYCEETVKEFFACMIPAVYHDRWVVRMGNIEVRISPADIDAYFHAPHRAELSATYGLSPHRAFHEQLGSSIAASLRRNGHTGWNKKDQHILKSEMHTDIAFLMLFVKASLKPSTHNTTADSQVAEVLYSLQNNLPMDIGHIIWMEILDAGITLDGVLPFPNLITHFCREAGVPIGQLKASKGDFKITQYRHQITAANKLEARRRVDPNYQVRELAEPDHESESASDSDPDFNPDAPEAPAAAAYVHDDDTPLYMRRFMDHMTATVGGINTNVNFGFQGVHQRLDGYGNRLDGIDTRLAQAGFQPQQEPPAAPQGRRRVRGRQDEDAPSSSRR